MRGGRERKVEGSERERKEEGSERGGGNDRFMQFSYISLSFLFLGGVII